VAAARIESRRFLDTRGDSAPGRAGLLNSDVILKRTEGEGRTRQSEVRSARGVDPSR
jgi:hypothetical protein